MKIKQHGGARKGAGAKKKQDKKVGLTIYVKNSIIEEKGGKEKCKQMLKDYINK